jgi:phosphoserine phosphatase
VSEIVLINVSGRDRPGITARLTGEISGEIVDGRRKADLLREIAIRKGIRLPPAKSAQRP